MNGQCDVEYSEWDGQYPRESNGAIYGCHCRTCETTRSRYYEPEPKIETIEPEY